MSIKKRAATVLGSFLLLTAGVALASGSGQILELSPCDETVAEGIVNPKGKTKLSVSSGQTKSWVFRITLESKYEPPDPDLLDGTYAEEKVVAPGNTIEHPIQLSYDATGRTGTHILKITVTGREMGSTQEQNIAAQSCTYEVGGGGTKRKGVRQPSTGGGIAPGGPFVPSRTGGGIPQ